jgi:hypothetical protein
MIALCLLCEPVAAPVLKMKIKNSMNEMHLDLLYKSILLPAIF